MGERAGGWGSSNESNPSLAHQVNFLVVFGTLFFFLIISKFPTNILLGQPEVLGYTGIPRGGGGGVKLGIQ